MWRLQSSSFTKPETCINYQTGTDNLPMPIVLSHKSDIFDNFDCSFQYLL